MDQSDTTGIEKVKCLFFFPYSWLVTYKEAFASIPSSTKVHRFLMVPSLLSSVRAGGLNVPGAARPPSN